MMSYSVWASSMQMSGLCSISEAEKDQKKNPTAQFDHLVPASIELCQLKCTAMLKYTSDEDEVKEAECRERQEERGKECMHTHSVCT